MIITDYTITPDGKVKEYKPHKRNKVNLIIGIIIGFTAIVGIPTLAETITNTQYTQPTETETDWAELEEAEHKVDTLYVTSPTEQKYIVRYATAFDIADGVTTYIDSEGNEWKAIDAPTEMGCVARLLFDSKETVSIYDDEIIDITE